MTITISDAANFYSGSDLQEIADEMKQSGSDYCTDARAVDGLLILELTEKQRDNLVERNNAFIQQLMDPFFDSDPSYSFKASDDYSELTFYYDEHLPREIEATAVFGVVGAYGYNHTLMSKTSDWSIHVKIYNCHTKKLAFDNWISYGESDKCVIDWEGSYVE